MVQDVMVPLDPMDEVTAVIAVDLQEATRSLSSVTDMEVVVANSARIVRAFRASGMPVVLAKNDLNRPPAGRTSYAGRTTPVSDESLDVVAELGSTPDDIVVVRGAWSAFTGTDLDATLRQRNVTQVVIVGLATNFGVESTARAAYDLGYHVVVPSDAVTGPMQVAHYNTLDSVIPALGQVATTDEVLANMPT
jgi:nicotinamidase-related amidase